MTSGMPSSIQNWVLPGFQYRRLLASASSLLVNPSSAAAAETAGALSSAPAMRTSAGRRRLRDRAGQYQFRIPKQEVRFCEEASTHGDEPVTTLRYGHVNGG